MRSVHGWSSSLCSLQLTFPGLLAPGQQFFKALQDLKFLCRDEKALNLLTIEDIIGDLDTIVMYCINGVTIGLCINISTDTVMQD